MLRIFSSGLLKTQFVRGKHLMVGLDGTDFGLAALEFAVHRKRPEDTITALHIKQAEVSSEMVFEKAKAVAGDVPVEWKAYAASSSPKTCMVKACEEFKVDMLLLGSRGLSHNISEYLNKRLVEGVGSVPDYCVHNAPCDVVVVKPKAV
eukprot:NODE_5768_length_613_cov_52.532922_g5604_i0.p1 GENE.NODE_5768_length_613_cov_52.532922_g5604_i0~~NODE_5768_length_613_cov_52.532922_g5604_i0.p1  ORF type:complete len:149 (-),score=34.61 NODE_5768_length_613_cov_52.532922_g5604_i0:105-551(-)